MWGIPEAHGIHVEPLGMADEMVQFQRDVSHENVRLEGGLPLKAQLWTFGLVRAVLRGVAGFIMYQIQKNQSMFRSVDYFMTISSMKFNLASFQVRSTHFKKP